MTQAFLWAACSPVLNNPFDEEKANYYYILFYC